MDMDTYITVFFSFSCALSSVFITWNITLHELFIWNRKGNMDRSYGRAPGGGESGAAAVFFFSPAHASSCLFCLLVCRKCTPAAGGMRKIRKRREKKSSITTLCNVGGGDGWDGVCVCWVSLRLRHIHDHVMKGKFHKGLFRSFTISRRLHARQPTL